MAKNELLPFADGEDANVLPTNQWEALTDILENGFQSGIARSEQVNRVLSQGAVASYVLGQLIVDQLNKDATLDKSALYQNLILALQENAKDACLPLSGGNVTGNLSVQSKNVVRSVNGLNADASGNVAITVSDGTVSTKVSTSLTISGRTAKTYTVTGLTANKPVFIGVKRTDTVTGYVYFWVSSGTGVETSTNNNTLYGQEDNITIDNERAYWFPVVPTGTSIVFSYYIASDNTATLSLVVYQ